MRRRILGLGSPRWLGGVLSILLIVQPAVASTGAGLDGTATGSDELANVASDQLDLVRQLEGPDGDGALDVARAGLHQRKTLVGTILPSSLQPNLDRQEQNVDEAQRLRQTFEDLPADGLAPVLEAVRPTLLDVAPSTATQEGSDATAPPSEVFARIAERVDGTAVDPTALGRLDRPSPETRQALAALGEAFLKLHRVASEDGGVPGLQPTSMGIGAAPGAAQAEFLAAVASLDRTMAASLASSSCSSVRIPPAFSVGLGRCDSVYEQDVALLVDFGGNDRYGRENTSEACGTNGGGYLGVGTLIDEGGDDVYLGSGDGSNGGANQGGRGLLVDAEGDDLYVGEGYGLNGGAGPLGEGLLLDAGGNDEYDGTRYGVNGGSWAGRGRLIDLTGDDRYDATVKGVNGGGMDRGHGFLWDRRGDDHYSATYSGTNGGADQAATGFLHDAGGDDRFQGGLEGGNGGATAPGAVGMLVAEGGNDTYRTAYGGVNGGAGGGAAGFLIDVGGNDDYLGTKTFLVPGGANGGATKGPAAGFLYDASGDDIYDGTQYWTNGAAGVGTAGFLFDRAGVDRYRVISPGYYTGASLRANGFGHAGVGLLADGNGTGDRYCADGLADECDPEVSGTDRTIVPRGIVGAQLDIDPRSQLPASWPVSDERQR